jgi:opacity protein-like surface antigen
MRPVLALVAIATLAGAPDVARAQSSQFGIRGLGLPMRALSPRAVATGGAFGLFDVESSVNPAAVAAASQFTSLFTSAQSFRSSTNPFGSTSGRDNRFPQVIAAGPIGGTRLGGAVSVSGYTDRSFSLATEDTIELRGAPVPVFDTLSSRGGLTDIRVALGWRVSGSVGLGLGLHAIPGSNRIENHRAFGDTAYGGAIERSEISYLGFGVSGGVTFRPTPWVTVAAMVRSDGHVNVERDTIPIGRTDLPLAVSGGIRWQPALNLAVAAAYAWRNWSTADADLRAQGGIGALDAHEISAGIEILKDPRLPGHRPWRFGVRYATLPFPVRADQQAHEYGLSAGTGIRFTGGRGGLDLALEQIWRSDGAGFTERATVVTLGVSLRP